MAGTLPNLPLSTQFDQDSGQPLRGGKLWFFRAGTISTPQNAYRDSGLTQPHPNPITLDGAGRVPSFYLADGATHIRLTNAQGVTQFEEMDLLVIGPSSGEGGGGSTVDATALFRVGDVIWLDQAGPRSGWVRDNGRTIGSATSGASERANADCQGLYAFLWQTYPDSVCPVNGGRGASVAADWSANKWIALPDKRGYVPGGLDDMGNEAANRFAGAPFWSGNSTTAGSVCGEAAHTLTVAEMPTHTHPPIVGDPPHTHGLSYGSQLLATSGGTSYNPNATGGYWGNSTILPAASGVTVSIPDTGGGVTHNNVQPTVLGTFYRKL